MSVAWLAIVYVSVYGIQDMAGNCLCELFTVHRTWLAIVYVSVYGIQDMSVAWLAIVYVSCLQYTGHVSCRAVAIVYVSVYGI